MSDPNLRHVGRPDAPGAPPASAGPDGPQGAEGEDVAQAEAAVESDLMALEVLQRERDDYLDTLRRSGDARCARPSLGPFVDDLSVDDLVVAGTARRSVGTGRRRRALL